MTENPDVPPEWLVKALDALYAYDSGSTDSGIHDVKLKEKCKVYLRGAVEGDNDRKFFSRLIRDMWLSEEAINQGYGIEDALRFIDWLSEEMGIDL